MKEWVQARNFYDSLSPAEKDDLIGAVAENILFLEDDLQRRVLLLLQHIDRNLSEEVAKRNRFTM